VVNFVDSEWWLFEFSTYALSKVNGWRENGTEKGARISRTRGLGSCPSISTPDTVLGNLRAFRHKYLELLYSFVRDWHVAERYMHYIQHYIIYMHTWRPSFRISGGVKKIVRGVNEQYIPCCM